MTAALPSVCSSPQWNTHRYNFVPFALMKDLQFKNKESHIHHLYQNAEKHDYAIEKLEPPSPPPPYLAPPLNPPASPTSYMRSEEAAEWTLVMGRRLNEGWF